LFCLLTKRKPALVIRAVQLVLQESIGAIGVRHGAARQASPASGPPVISPAAKIWGVEVRRYPSTFANPPKIRLDGRRSEAQPRSIGHPAHRYDRKCRLVRRKRCKGLRNQQSACPRLSVSELVVDRAKSTRMTEIIPISLSN
jgi:hypothetical protein